MSAAKPFGSRWKVACINWSHADAPKAVAYYYFAGETRHERYFDTWAEAITWADKIARKKLK